MTTSLELSKQLYEKGLKIKTEKKWSNWHYGVLTFGKPAELFKGGYRLVEISSFIDDSEIPAPSADELLAVMPYKIDTLYYLVACKAFSDYIIRYFDYEKLQKIRIVNKSFPEALGQMCLWLLNNGYQFNGKELVTQ